MVKRDLGPDTKLIGAEKVRIALTHAQEGKSHLTHTHLKG